jgi:zinc protease
MIGKLIKMYQSVTKEDVMRVYDQYIRLRHPVVLSVLPKEQDKLTTASNNFRY